MFYRSLSHMGSNHVTVSLGSCYLWGRMTPWNSVALVQQARVSVASHLMPGLILLQVLLVLYLFLSTHHSVPLSWKDL